jgi:serine/threonine-protein kinase
MKTIKLDIGEWKYDPDKQLGSKGGFGTVFAGTGKGHSKLAIKKLNIEAKEAAHRELKISKDLAGRKLSHVIPVLDSDQDADSDFYFVVMALADKSLQDELDSGKIFDDIEAANILLQIAKGLSEVSDIVHRDLKPANILFHEEKWKVADFGIARFVEESTSLQTLKGCLTPPYAAPEQWKFERSSNATDVYALGCIGYSLLTGHPPFHGSNETLKHQHLTESPPRLENHHPQLCSLLTRMLRKDQESRPNLNRIKEILKKISEGDNNYSSQTGLTALMEAGEQEAAYQAEQEARQQSAKLNEQHLQNIASNAHDLFIEIRKQLFEKMCRATTIAEHSENLISLGNAQLSMHTIYRHDERLVLYDAFPQSKWNVLAAGIILVRQIEPKYEWSSSLWYSKLPGDNNYRWREVSYFGNPLIPKDKLNIEFEPFGLTNCAGADRAASQTIGKYQIAFGPKPIDDEDFDDFCNRWADILAKAANGQLSYPRTLPLQ